MMNQIRRLCPQIIISKPYLLNTTNLRRISTTIDNGGGDDEWNDTWETAWLPEDLSAKNRAPWETDVHFDQNDDVSPNIGPETKAFVQDMKDNWEERRKSPKQQLLLQQQKERKEKQLKNLDPKSLYSLEKVKKDYRLKKQRIHAALWSKEIEKQEEAKLSHSILGNASAADDIDNFLDSCSEIFDSGNNDMMNNGGKVPPTGSEFNNMPDGWEKMAKASDGNVWEMSQREEDILLQEFERRIAYSKFQIASFIKTHIFSRRRPIDGWKYMIEELGPNARKGKGSVSRLPSLADPSTQPFREEKVPVLGTRPSHKGR